MSNKSLLRTLRELHVLVAHPEDHDGEELVRQLRRIGCRTQIEWPLPVQHAIAADMVFCVTDRQTFAQLATGDGLRPYGLIAIVDYEDPAILDQMIDANVQGVVTKPIRPFGILSTLVTARATYRAEQRLHQKITKLEDALRGRREIERSVRILMENLDLTEKEAYQTLQRRAMEQRQPLAAVASAMVQAHTLLSEIGITGRRHSDE